MGLPLEKNGELDRDEIPYSFFSGYDAYTLWISTKVVFDVHGSWWYSSSMLHSIVWQLLSRAHPLYICLPEMHWTAM